MDERRASYDHCEVFFRQFSAKQVDETAVPSPGAQTQRHM
jgi:hypothetical protein